MINLIKSINYQIKNNNLTYIIFILAIAVMFIPFFNINGGDFSALTAGNYYVQALTPMSFVFLIFNVLMITQVCGFDFNDKTINYEVMSGHSKKEVYFARVITSYVWALTGMILVTLVPVFLISLFFGWGKELLFQEFVQRYVVYLLQAARLFAFEILFTFAVNNQIAAAIVSCVISEIPIIIGLMLEEMLGIKLEHIFALLDIMNLTEQVNTKTIVLDGEEINRFIVGLSPEYILWTVISSVVMGTIYIIAGYVIFKKRDMK